MAASLPDHDPAPSPPLAPGPGDCCRSGCMPCVFDLYEQALAHYRAEHEAWLARRAQAGRSAGKSAPS